MNRLRKLGEAGQSVWLDYIRRNLMTSGELGQLIERDGLCGMTSNPAIFEKAINGGEEYREILTSVATVGGRDTKSIYEAIAIEDIRMAAEAMMPVYTRTARRDGYVSLEVSPTLARQTEATCQEARRLWNEVAAPNLMIKVPATAEGIPAIEQLVAEGINVNVTLLFAQHAYRAAAEAYVRGLERFAESGGRVARVAGVASFFVSRIDTAIDAMLARKIEVAGSQQERSSLEALLGKAAIASAKLAYEKYKEIFATDRWGSLEAMGAQTQRVLWASTSTKSPSYRDVLYIEELIGPDTVTTIPPNTYDAFLDHGEIRNSLDEDVAGARGSMADLELHDISIDAVTAKLLDDGVDLFATAFEKLLAAIEAATHGGGDR